MGLPTSTGTNIQKKTKEAKKKIHFRLEGSVFSFFFFDRRSEIWQKFSLDVLSSNVRGVFSGYLEKWSKLAKAQEAFCSNNFAECCTY